MYFLSLWVFKIYIVNEQNHKWLPNPRAAECWDFKAYLKVHALQKDLGQIAFQGVTLIQPITQPTYLKRPLEIVGRKAGSLNLVKG